MKNYSYELPWPPSANHYWFLVACKGGGRKVIGKKGKEFRAAVCDLIDQEKPLEGRIVVVIYVYPPDRRKRDLDNILKATLDSLEDAKVFLDDNQIDVLKVCRKEVVKGGKIEVNVHEYKES